MDLEYFLGETARPAISGENGHNTCFAVVCQLLRMGGLQKSNGELVELLRRCYNPRCVPPWSLKELHHKVTDARKAIGSESSVTYFDRERFFARQEVKPRWINEA